MSRKQLPFRDFTFEKKHESELKNLQNLVSDKNYRDLDLFLINSNLDIKQKSALIKIIFKIYSDVESNTVHSMLNTEKK